MAFNGPTSIPGLKYYWNFNDLAQGEQVESWTDRVSGVVLQPARANAPLNESLGVLFDNTANSLTNIPLNISSNFTLWCVFRPVPVGFPQFVSIDDNNIHTIFGEYGFGGAGYGLAYTKSIIYGYWGSTNMFSTAVFSSTNASLPTYDIVDSEGILYTNATAVAIGVAQPMNNFSFQSLGADSSDNNIYGYVQYLGIWTNCGLNQLDVSNLDNWVNTNGVTNVTDGLIAWWRLDEGRGVTVADSSGDGNSGTISGTPQWVPGVVGNALCFNGNGQVVTIGNTNLADNLTNFTVTLWLKGTNFNSGSIATAHGSAQFIGKNGVGGVNNGQGWGFFNDSGANIAGYTQDTNSDYFETPHSIVFPTINDGGWHYCVCTFNNNTNLMFYVDAIPIMGSPLGTDTAVTSTSNPSSIIIGGDNLGNDISASLDDVRIYNRLLTPQEIADLYRWRGQP
jgi:hypothetical protein